MLKKLLSITLVLFASTAFVYSQVGQGALKGKIIDRSTGEPLPFVNVVVEQNGTQVAGAASDFDGKYTVKPISPGKYNVKATFTGYQPLLVTGVVVSGNSITFKDLDMGQTSVTMEEFEVIEYTVPLISKDQTSSGGTVTKEDIQRMPGRSANSVAQTVGGVYSKDDGTGDLSIRGGRSDATYYYIDGIKVRGSTGLPQSALEQVTVITGGVPAQYGDVTGGLISITTRGASREYFGGIEYVTSGWKVGENKTVGLDAYGYNLLEFSLSGPLFMKKDTSGKKTDPLVGFFLAGNLTSIVDGSPQAGGMWKIKDGVQQDINETPLRFATTGNGTFQNAEFLRTNAFEKVKFRQNVAQKGVNVSGKLDFNLSSNTNLTFGGNLDFRKNHQYIYTYSLTNSANNPERINQDWRVFGRFTQRFSSQTAQEDEKSASTIKNAYYSVQVDYSKNKFKRWDDSHKDNFFNYGYVGKFVTYTQPDYGGFGGLGTYIIDGDTLTGVVQQTFEDTLVAFYPDTVTNPEMAQYTINYYKLYGWDFENSTEEEPAYDYEAAQDPNNPQDQNFFLKNFTNITNNGGYINGVDLGRNTPDNIYGLWASSAEQFNAYNLQDESQLRVSATGSADIKDHAISIGFEYEQRVDRFYTMQPRDLWTIGRQLTNGHIENLDLTTADTVALVGQFPVINYERQNAAPGEYTAEDAQSFFDYNLRKSLGLNPDGNEFVDFDSYGPEAYSINYFSPDELLNDGNSLVSYSGYDPYGNKLSSDPSFDDFFTATDEFGNFTRPIGAFRPIYIAGYIQDKFSFDDLVFNIGVRVDRFDANQQVLKDPFVFFPTVKAGEQEALDLVGEDGHPETIGDDFVVYVDNVNNPNAVVGYRSGTTWYNSEGTEIANPDVLKTGSGIAPLLVDKDKTESTEISSEAFEDYTPQTNFMPRIAFSFPISDEALFFAHYDVLTQRPQPSNALRLDPIDYFYIVQNNPITNVAANPSLKPQKTIDYEVGFQQKLTNSSSLKISGFYREQRDMIQLVNVDGAFPGPGLYATYGNIDFGTIKGMTVAYDLRRTGNIWMRASYTLQFAEGTGSDFETAQSLINANKPNLRTATPLSFDQRHTITTTVDYRFGGGKDYTGPVWFNKQIFANTGANVVLNGGSGTPYSAQANVIRTAGGSGRSVLEGSINGSRLPWQFRIDARIDRDIELTLGKDEDKKPLQMNVYLQILNVLNSRNITNVYRVTGNPDDDGYLAEPTFQPEIQSQTNEQSFREYYTMRINNPGNYSLPRRIRLGVMINF